MAEYLFAVQSEDGREVVSKTLNVKKVSEVTAEIRGQQVYLLHDGEALGDGHDIVEGTKYQLHRWRSGDKLAAPVSRPIS